MMSCLISNPRPLAHSPTTSPIDANHRGQATESQKFCGYMSLVSYPLAFTLIGVVFFSSKQGQGFKGAFLDPPQPYLSFSHYKKIKKKAFQVCQRLICDITSQTQRYLFLTTHASINYRQKYTTQPNKCPSELTSTANETDSQANFFWLCRFYNKEGDGLSSEGQQVIWKEVGHFGVQTSTCRKHLLKRTNVM